MEISTEDIFVVLMSAREDRGNQRGSESLTLPKAVNESICTLQIYCPFCLKFGTCGLHVLPVLSFCEFIEMYWSLCLLKFFRKI